MNLIKPTFKDDGSDTTHTKVEERKTTNNINDFISAILLSTFNSRQGRSAQADQGTWKATAS